MTATTIYSPTSPFIFVRNAAQDKDMVLKTQPFYSIFYHTEDVQNTNFPNRVRQKSTDTQNKTPDGRSCRAVFSGPTYTNPKYILRKQLPFSLFTDSGSSNLYFLMVVFLATIVLGTVVFSYWIHLLGNNAMDEDFRKVIEKRSFYLSIFFVVMVVVLSVMSYEYFTLKFLSLRWFRNYQENEPSQFYDFLFNTRKIFLWGFLVLWLAIVLFITITISKRPENFKNQIAVNVVSIMMLLLSQYLYYKTPSRLVKTFCLFINVFVVGLVVFLLSS
jgi:hypothetical protein